MDSLAYSPVQRLEAFHLENRKALLGFIRSKVGDESWAEDILQDSLFKALRGVPELEEEEKLAAWFYQIIRNTITDAHRRQAVAKRRLDQYMQEQPTSISPNEVMAVICKCFEKLLPTLKPEYAELINAMDLEETARETVAKRLGIRPNNLKVRHHRARRQLRDRLEATCQTCAENGCIDCTCGS